VVESRTEKTAIKPDFVGVNSVQLYNQGGSWQILLLYYLVEKPDLPIVALNAVSGRSLNHCCLAVIFAMNLRPPDGSIPRPMELQSKPLTGLKPNARSNLLHFGTFVFIVNIVQLMCQKFYCAALVLSPRHHANEHCG